MSTRGKMFKMCVEDLQPGDVVDLEGDMYADPDHNVVDYIYEYQVVASVEIEFHWAHVVTFESDYVVSFPPNHELPIMPAGGFGGTRGEGWLDEPEVTS